MDEKLKKKKTLLKSETMTLRPQIRAAASQS